MEEKLKKLLKHAYAPYSKYRVSGIVVMKDNHEFYGVNVENASYGATICAERNAILNAITNGYKKSDFKKLYVMTDSPKIGNCCFLCRQVIVEFMDRECEVINYNNKGDYQITKVSELCPYIFGSEDLLWKVVL